MPYCFSVVLLLRIIHGFRTLNLRQLFLFSPKGGLDLRLSLKTFQRKIHGSWANSLICDLYDVDRGAFPAATAQETLSGLHPPEILATKAKVDIFWPKAK